MRFALVCEVHNRRGFARTLHEQINSPAAPGLTLVVPLEAANASVRNRLGDRIFGLLGMAQHVAENVIGRINRTGALKEAELGA